jgi:hypothetical protein
MNKKIVPDLIDKVVDLSGIIFEMVGKRNGREIALKILKSEKQRKS